MTEKPHTNPASAADSASEDQTRPSPNPPENHDSADIVGSQLRILRRLAEAVAAALRAEMRATDGMTNPPPGVDADPSD
jgi:hypothetical protein